MTTTPETLLIVTNALAEFSNLGSLRSSAELLILSGSSSVLCRVRLSETPFFKLVNPTEIAETPISSDLSLDGLTETYEIRNKNNLLIFSGPVTELFDSTPTLQQFDTIEILQYLITIGTCTE